MIPRDRELGGCDDDTRNREVDEGLELLKSCFANTSEDSSETWQEVILWQHIPDASLRLFLQEPPSFPNRDTKYSHAT